LSHWYQGGSWSSLSNERGSEEKAVLAHHHYFPHQSGHIFHLYDIDKMDDKCYCIVMGRMLDSYCAIDNTSDELFDHPQKAPIETYVVIASGGRGNL
jgi:hypothetical protein